MKTIPWGMFECERVFLTIPLCAGAVEAAAAPPAGKPVILVAEKLGKPGARFMLWSSFCAC